MDHLFDQLSNFDDEIKLGQIEGYQDVIEEIDKKFQERIENFQQKKVCNLSHDFTIPSFTKVNKPQIKIHSKKKETDPEAEKIEALKKLEIQTKDSFY